MSGYRVTVVGDGVELRGTVADAGRLRDLSGVARANLRNWLVVASPTGADDPDRVRPEVAENPFDDALTVSALLHELAGAASVCWATPEGAGEFRSEQAGRFCVQAEVRLWQILGLVPDAMAAAVQA